MSLDNPCRCGSGLPYKRCHRPLDRTPARRYLAEARKFYIGRWAVNASMHARAGHYDWMIDQIPGRVHRLLDIGVGEGAGLATMLRRLAPRHAIGLEENPECVRRARAKLAHAGYRAEVVTRMTTVPLGPDTKAYGLAFDRDDLSDKGVAILVTDPLFDPTLQEDLAALGRFDLITVWLVGAHEAREHSCDLMALGPMTSARYRLLVQNRAYELADALLAVGGRLQIVDRLPAQDLDLASDDLAANHADQAAPTSLEVADIAFCEYRESGSAGIKMLLRDEGQGTPLGNASRTLLASVVAVKR